MEANYKDRIASNPDVMLGKPVIKGTRITVELILRKLSEGAAIDEILQGYPNLTKDDILACLSYSADVIGEEELIAS
ncbi:MAG: DUF433 domain-containing protein [Deltaproteobacteria bacterium]|jgi:uncharacterized protein (DUF433 family)|nr:DUF433 domain-containing protein [Deltaproteobacteria bacterium]MCL5879811.1 DUF433 domain-containing protein [Deltaproteobacteria bacterium]MDA8303906.1 DUF433 domain-containing protein [Deltaproteobacteria bacterium]